MFNSVSLSNFSSSKPLQFFQPKQQDQSQAHRAPHLHQAVFAQWHKKLKNRGK